MGKESGCPEEMFKCTNSLQCSLALKSQILKKFFGGFGFKFGHNAFYHGPGDHRLNEKGGWYQKLKEFLFFQGEKLKQMVLQIGFLFGQQDCPSLNPFNDFEYEITPEGRDFMKDGEKSGVYQ